ncbi:MAG: iron-containing alcohol dehydrogenase [Lachnospiraceae bacterium]|nr:iron-containing alcohol dehydrogenase [Lachnospiraceae bacterium]
MNFQPILEKEMHCSCGRVHSTDLKAVDIGRGALERLPELLRGLGFHKAYIAADVNTWEAAGKKAAAILASRGFAFESFVLPDPELVPDEAAVGALLLHMPQDADMVLAVGSGTINDLCKYISRLRGLPYVILATAPSMDGFVSAGAALIVDHVKVTYDAQGPAAVLADTEILAQAPMEMITAGLGDMLGKYTCLLDWKLAHIITGEYYCEHVEGMVRTALRTILSQSSRIRERDPEVIGAITEALVLTGIAMKFVGNSRPASGCEHHMSHFWEMLFLMNGKKAVLHGTKVGVAAVACLQMYGMLAEILESSTSDPGKDSGRILSAADPNPEEDSSRILSAADPDPEKDSSRILSAADPDLFAAAAAKPFDKSMWEEEIRAVFGEAADGIIALEEKSHKNDPAARNIRLDTIRDRRAEILWAIRHDLPAVSEIEELLLSLDAPVHPEQIGVSLQEVRGAVLYAKEVRNRYTLLQLLWDLGLSVEFADRLSAYYSPQGLTLKTAPAGSAAMDYTIGRSGVENTKEDFCSENVPCGSGLDNAPEGSGLAIPQKTQLPIQKTYFRWKKEKDVRRLQKIRCFVLDMDGTIYLSNRLFPFTIPFLNKLADTGRSYCFFTNNSTKHQQDYLGKLSGMGIPVTESQVFLSTQVILEEMSRLHREDSFFIVGTPNLVEAFRRAGLRVFNPESEAPGSMPDVVILGFDTTLTYERISLACKYLRHGSAYYGVNMDYNCPVDDNGVLDYIPDCGSIAKLIERSTGRFPDFYGKPSRHALDYIIRHTGFKEEEIAVVGDRIYTDIAIANGTKALSIMVLTGETQLEDLDQYDFRPDIILPSLAEITELL